MRDQCTFSQQMDKLDKTQRVEEIARMLGGRDVTSAVMTQARELIGQR